MDDRSVRHLCSQRDSGMLAIALLERAISRDRGRHDAKGQGTESHRQYPQLISCRLDGFRMGERSSSLNTLAHRRRHPVARSPRHRLKHDPPHGCWSIIYHMEDLWSISNSGNAAPILQRPVRAFGRALCRGPLPNLYEDRRRFLLHMQHSSSCPARLGLLAGHAWDLQGGLLAELLPKGRGEGK